MGKTDEMVAKGNRPKLTAWGRRVAVVVALAGLAIAPSACGSSNSSGQTTTTTAPNGY